MTAILILGGTGEAFQLAGSLAGASDWRIVTALAGRTREPRIPPGEIRVGGFGGESGLVDYLRAQSIDLLINATHPFAAEISAHALAASRASGVPVLRLLRPPWNRQPGDRWIMVENASAAARQCRQLGGVIFLTLGVKELSRFAGIDNARFIARAIERPEPHALPGCDFVMARGPFDFRSERDFMRQRQISALVAKQSGGEATRAKIDAARDLGISVVMIDRPAIARDPGCDVACDVEAALKWISARGHEIMSARDPGIHGQSGQA